MTKRLHGPARQALLDSVAARYRAGETIRQIAAGIGYSYTATRAMLLRSGVVLRESRFSADLQPQRAGGEQR